VLLLQAHSLVTVDDTGCAAMHAVTQHVVRDWITPKAQRAVLVAALAAVLASKLLKFDEENPATFFIGRRYARHAGAVAARAREWGVLPVAQPCLVGGSGGVDAGLGGRVAEGAVLDNIVAMCQQAGHSLTGSACSLARRCAGTRWPWTVPLHGTATTTQTWLHVMVISATCTMCRASMPRRLSSFRKASRSIFVCSAANIKRWPPTTITSATVCKATTNRMQGDYENALLQHQKSLEIRNRVFGCDSAEVAMSYNNIGNVYRKQGDNENALRQYHKSLEIMLRVYGQKHPLVAGSYHNIGY